MNHHATDSSHTVEGSASASEWPPGGHVMDDFAGVGRSGRRAYAVGIVGVLPVPLVWGSGYGELSLPFLVVGAVAMLVAALTVPGPLADPAVATARGAANWALTVLGLIGVYAVATAALPIPDSWPLWLPGLFWGALHVAHVAVVVGGVALARPGKALRNAVAVPFLSTSEPRA